MPHFRTVSVVSFSGRHPVSPSPERRRARPEDRVLVAGGDLGEEAGVGAGGGGVGGAGGRQVRAVRARVGRGAGQQPARPVRVCQRAVPQQLHALPAQPTENITLNCMFSQMCEVRSVFPPNPSQGHGKKYQQRKQTHAHTHTHTHTHVESALVPLAPLAHDDETDDDVEDDEQNDGHDDDDDVLGVQAAVTVAAAVASCIETTHCDCVFDSFAYHCNFS